MATTLVTAVRSPRSALTMSTASPSLPVGPCPVPVEQVGGGAGRYIAERLSSMVLPSALGRARIRDEGPRRLYADPALRSPRLYKVLLGLLMERNLLDFYTESACSVGVFFVHKKNRAGLGLSWHNAHRNGARIYHVGADKKPFEKW